MLSTRWSLTIAAAIAAICALASCEDRPAPGAAGPQGVPGVDHPGEGGVWICPMCPGVLALEPGRCRECGMELINTPTALLWKCVRHPPVIQDAEGICPVCEEPLRPVTMAALWRCPEHREKKLRRPGTCAECGAALEEIFEPLPHGDHNPRHGGQFFMAADNFHHLEGTLPEEGLFRLYLYDDFSRPLPAERGSGRLEVPLAPPGDIEAGPEEPPARAIPLRTAAGGECLEARIAPEDFRLPFQATAFVRFGEAGKDSRFDFHFERAAAGAAGEKAASTAPAPKPAAPAAEPEPASPAEIAMALAARGREVRALISGGRWDRLYLPALAARDLALRLLDRGENSSWDEPRRRALDRAAREVVRGAWLLDLHGDGGNGPRVEESYRVFSGGIEGVKLLFPRRDETQSPRAVETPPPAGQN